MAGCSDAESLSTESVVETLRRNGIPCDWDGSRLRVYKGDEPRVFRIGDRVGRHMVGNLSYFTGIERHKFYHQNIL